MAYKQAIKTFRARSQWLPASQKPFRKMIKLPAFIGFLLLFECSCGQTKQKPTSMNTSLPYTNELIHESSPYLLQHAHNPVNWYPWSEAALKKAKEENKLVIISIGYAACHWCHVMEHESFEDTAVAGIMNRYFVSIKVDREERPDVDQVYMTASQLINGSGGWPLNALALPDGRPFFAGTYFPKNNWIQMLQYFVQLNQTTPSSATPASSPGASAVRRKAGRP